MRYDCCEDISIDCENCKYAKGGKIKVYSGNRYDSEKLNDIFKFIMDKEFLVTYREFFNHNEYLITTITKTHLEDIYNVRRYDDMGDCWFHHPIMLLNDDMLEIVRNTNMYKEKNKNFKELINKYQDNLGVSEEEILNILKDRPRRYISN